METVSWNALGEGDYEQIDYITIDGFALNLDMVRNVGFCKDRVDIYFKVKHGFNTFLSLLAKLCGEQEIMTVRVSNYHGGYMLASAVVTFEDDTQFSLPDNMIVTLKAKNVRLDTYSNYDETVYMTEVKQKD